MNRQPWLLPARVVILLLVSLPAVAKNEMQVVVIPVANMYSKPTDKADVVSQAIYASNVKLLEARGEWSRIETADHYRGWTPSRYLRIILTANGYATAGSVVQVESLPFYVRAVAGRTEHAVDAISTRRRCRF